MSIKRQWFALCSDNTMKHLGDFGDFNAAEECADDLGLEVVWLLDRETLTDWVDVLSASA